MRSVGTTAISRLRRGFTSHEGSPQAPLWEALHCTEKTISYTGLGRIQSDTRIDIMIPRRQSLCRCLMTVPWHRLFVR